MAGYTEAFLNSYSNKATLEGVIAAFAESVTSHRMTLLRGIVEGLVAVPPDMSVIEAMPGDVPQEDIDFIQNPENSYERKLLAAGIVYKNCVTPFLVAASLGDLE